MFLLLLNYFNVIIITVYQNIAVVQSIYFLIYYFDL